MGGLAGVERFGDGDYAVLLWRKGIASERYRGSMEVTGIISMAIAVATNEHAPSTGRGTACTVDV